VPSTSRDIAKDINMSLTRQELETLLNQPREGEAPLNLSDRDLSGLDLSNLDLQGAILSGCDLRGANLSHTKLVWANLEDANFEDANLRNADLRGARAPEADLSCADLRDANLTNAVFRGADLTFASLSGATLLGTDFSHAKLDRADLSRTDFSSAKLEGTSLSGVKELFHRPEDPLEAGIQVIRGDIPVTYGITLSPSGRSFNCGSDQTLLDAAQKGGIEIPADCASGSCGQCKTKVLAGRYETVGLLPWALSAEEKADNITLLCRTFPRSHMTVSVRGATNLPTDAVMAEIDATAGSNEGPKVRLTLRGELPANTGALTLMLPGLPPRRARLDAVRGDSAQLTVLEGGDSGLFVGAVVALSAQIPTGVTCAKDEYQLQPLIQKATWAAVLVTSPGCGSCKAYEALWPRLGARMPNDMLLATVEGGNASQLTAEWEVFHLPALLLYRKGEPWSSIEEQPDLDILALAFAKAMAAPPNFDPLHTH